MSSPVIGSGPIGFTDASGKQQSIPLSLLYFEKSSIKADKSPLYASNAAVINALLQTLTKDGFLVPAPEPPPKPAIVLKAAAPGAKGNAIQVTFSNIVAGASPPSSTTFDAEIAAKATYLDLNYDPASPQFVGRVLGVGATAGNSPGLVRLKEPAPATATQPQAIATPKALTGGSTSAKSSLAIDGDPSGTAFTLEAWKDGTEGDNIKVSIPTVNAAAKTFTLAVEWTQPKITAIALADLPAKLQGNQFAIAVSKPEGADFAIPAPGTISLSGGADATEARPATALAFSS